MVASNMTDNESKEAIETLKALESKLMIPKVVRYIFLFINVHLISLFHLLKNLQVFSHIYRYRGPPLTNCTKVFLSHLDTWTPIISIPLFIATAFLLGVLFFYIIRICLFKEDYEYDLILNLE